MARKNYKPEEIVSKLRQVDVLHGQGMPMADAIRQIGVSEVSYHRWRKDYGGMKAVQLQRQKERLRRAVSERRACRVFGQHRSTQRHVPRGREDEEPLIADN